MLLRFGKLEKFLLKNYPSTPSPPPSSPSPSLSSSSSPSSSSPPLLLPSSSSSPIKSLPKVNLMMKTISIAQPNISFSQSLQTIVVTTADWSSTRGTARIFERKDGQSPWIQIGDSFDVVIGHNGMAWGIGIHPPPLDIEINLKKEEGDRKSPAGIFSLTSSFGAEKASFIKLPFTRLDEWTEGVDDVKSFHYNRIVNRMQVGIFDWKSSEKMKEIGEKYEFGIFVAHNSNPVVKGKGSCIFLHVWEENEEYSTGGCTAMSRENIQTVLKFLDPIKFPVLVQLPFETYKRAQTDWSLPDL